MSNWRDDVWFFDTEVLPHDWLFCATNGVERLSVHNDTQLLKEFLTTRNPFLCGYNCKHYDNYIIKAILAGSLPEDVKAVNDAIIVDGLQGWEIDMGWVRLPKTFDLMLDLPTMPSLKMIEGNLKMDIRESSVDFNTEYPTAGEWEELEEYCWHDVEALIPLYKAREDYLNAKETLAEMMGLNVKEALGMTNAKLTARFLGATRTERNDERDYVYPSNIDRAIIPPEIFKFFNRLPFSDIPLDILFGHEGVPDDDGKVVKSRNPYRALNIDIADCPHVLGWGGLHGARLNYSEKSTNERTILNYDVQSYYPSLMIVNKYISRNIENPEIFNEVYDKRIEAKRTGDKKTADALKLVLNTTYGASNNKYNDLYDPLMAHSVCISGQLYLIQLIRELELAVKTLVLIQSNTDGIMFSVDNEWIPLVRKIVAEWEQNTQFIMEESIIDIVVQSNVNNYAMKIDPAYITKKDDDGIKVKGGIVSDYKGGDFKHSSISIVCKAIVDNLLDGVKLEDTIEECNDIFAFQMIVKAGGTYDKVVHETAIGNVEVNRVNRIFASKDQRVGAVYKVKEAEKRRDRVASCPEHAIIDNSGTLSIDKINKKWYIDLALERLNKFKGIKPEKKSRRKKVKDEEELVVIDDDTPVEMEVKPKTRTKKTTKEVAVDTPITFKRKLSNLANDIAEASKAFVKDGYNSGQNYEYVKAGQYKAMLRNAIINNDLIMKIDDAVCQPSDILKGDKMTLTLYHGVLTIMDIDTDDKMTYMIWSQGADSLDKGLSKAKTLAIKDFIKANFLVSDNEDDPESDAHAKSTTTGNKKFITPAESKKKVANVVEDTAMATATDISQLKNGIIAIRTASGDSEYGAKVLNELEKGVTTSRVTVLKTKVEMKGDEYGLAL